MAKPDASELLSVPMGRWGVAAAPAQIRTLLGSCVGIVLHDAAARLGGVAHVVLPESNGSADHPGKFADTAIPALIDDLDRLRGRKLLRTLTAKLVGGASMFQAGAALNIGRRNFETAEAILRRLGIPVLASDVGGEAGRRLTLDVATGTVTIRIPGGSDYAI
jgi:chemotaxis protein CheD